MTKMKESKKYYFSVEGETEQWYLHWLQSQINEAINSRYKVTIDCPIEKDPLKRAKSMVVIGKTKIVHMFDCESNDEVHTTQFKTTLDRMKKVQTLGKQIKYTIGYSNFTFELWMILHKTDCRCSLTNRTQYLAFINRAYSEKFESLAQYKHRDSFERVLGKLDLINVKQAIERAKLITQDNKDKGYTMHEYKGYHYYTENPSLSIWESIEDILKECKLI